MNNFRRRVGKTGGIDPITGRGVIDGYEVVDLGLPSGLLWATCNVGANSETEYGNYYQWGAGSATYTEEDQHYQFVDWSGYSYNLDIEHDTAIQVMGGGYKTPNLRQMRELVNTSNTKREWVDVNGINCLKLTSKTNPNAYILFPAAGRYPSGSQTLLNVGDKAYVWTSYAYNERTAYALTAENNLTNMVNHESYSDWGLSVRAVHDPI